MEGDFLVYHQDEVHTIPTSQEEISVSGKLRIIERRNAATIEWRCSEDPESDWAVVNTSQVTFNNSNSSDLEISTARRHVRPILVELVDLKSYKLSSSGSLILIQRDGSTHPALQFPGKDAAYFVEVLQQYVAIKQSEIDPTLYLLLDKKDAEKDAKLAELNLVPTALGAARKRRPRPRPQGRPVRDEEGRNGSNTPSHSESPKAGQVAQWTHTSQRVMGFFNNFKKDPYTTTLSTLSKFYDNILYYEFEEGLASEREYGDDNPFNSLNGFDDMEPGYQLVSLKGELAERKEVERLPPLTPQELSPYCDVEGRVVDVNALKQRIFKGGLHPSLRSQLWCCLLGYHDWSSSKSEREEQSAELQRQYSVYKEQWSSITADQESRFTGFKERKSLIEKDVNRTDRSHSFYEGEDNPNVEALHNVLMSYVMYNFDLGYVQGMSDLLAPILYVTRNEDTAFWCFKGYLDMVHRNFDMDQSGMKAQLLGLQQVVAVVDPEFMSYLESKESANLYFCFRWLLVRYKRELSYCDTLRLWEVLWTGEPCPNFHLLVAAAILDQERATIMENKFGFTEILKHINDTSQRLDLSKILRVAEAIYHQVACSSSVPAPVLELLGLPVPPPSQESPVSPAEEATPSLATPEQKKAEEFVVYKKSDDDCEIGGAPGGSTSRGPSPSERPGLVGAVTTILGSAVRHIGEDLLSPVTTFQDDFSHHFT